MQTSVIDDVALSVHCFQTIRVERGMLCRPRMKRSGAYVSLFLSRSDESWCLFFPQWGVLWNFRIRFLAGYFHFLAPLVV